MTGVAYISLVAAQRYSTSKSKLNYGQFDNSSYQVINSFLLVTSFDSFPSSFGEYIAIDIAIDLFYILRKLTILSESTNAAREETIVNMIGLIALIIMALRGLTDKVNAENSLGKQ